MLWTRWSAELERAYVLLMAEGRAAKFAKAGRRQDPTTRSALSFLFTSHSPWQVEESASEYLDSVRKVEQLFVAQEIRGVPDISYIHFDVVCSPALTVLGPENREVYSKTNLSVASTLKGSLRVPPEFVPQPLWVEFEDPLVK